MFQSILKVLVLVFAITFSTPAYAKYIDCKGGDKRGLIYYISNVDVIFIGKHLTTRLKAGQEEPEKGFWILENEYQVVKAFKGVPKGQKTVSVYTEVSTGYDIHSDLSRFQPFKTKSRFVNPEHRFIEAIYKKDILKEHRFWICDRLMFTEFQKFIILDAYRQWPLTIFFLLLFPLIYFIDRRIANRRLNNKK